MNGEVAWGEAAPDYCQYAFYMQLMNKRDRKDLLCKNPEFLHACPVSIYSAHFSLFSVLVTKLYRYIPVRRGGISWLNLRNDRKCH